MGKQLIPPDEHGDVQEIALREALEERYLAYALSTIMHRALPDARARFVAAVLVRSGQPRYPVAP